MECVLTLLQGALNPDNDARNRAENIYLELEAKQPDLTGRSLICIFERSQDSAVGSQALFRVLNLFRKGKFGDAAREAMQERLLQYLASPGVAGRIKDYIVWGIEDAVESIRRRQRPEWPGLIETVSTLLSQDFARIAGVFVVWFRYFHDEMVYNIAMSQFSALPVKDSGSRGKMASLVLYRCAATKEFGAGMAGVMDMIGGLEDRDFGACLRVLDDVMSEDHMYFDSEITGKMMFMLLVNSANEERGELVRVQCLDVFCNMVSSSKTAKGVMLSNKEDVINVMVRCISCADSDVCKEGRKTMRRCMRSLFEDEACTMMPVIKNAMRANDLVHAFFLHFIEFDGDYPWIQAFMTHVHALVRRDTLKWAVRIVNQINGDERERLGDMIRPVLYTCLTTPLYQDYFALFEALMRKNMVPNDIVAGVFQCMCGIVRHTGDLKTLHFCANICNYGSKDKSAATWMTAMAMTIFTSHHDTDALRVVGLCFNYLDEPERAKVLSNLNFTESDDVLRSNGFMMIIEQLCNDSCAMILPGLLNRVFAIASEPFEMRLISDHEAGDRDDDDLQYTEVSDGVAVCSRVGLKRLEDLLRLLSCVINRSPLVCGKQLPAILEIVKAYDAGPAHLFHDLRTDFVGFLVLLIEHYAEYEELTPVTVIVVGFLIDILHKEKQFDVVGTICTGLQLLMKPDGPFVFPAGLFESIIDAVAHVTIAMNETIQEYSDEDGYFDEWTESFVVTFAEDISQFFPEAYTRCREVGIACFEKVRDSIPHFADKTAHKVIRAVSAFLWSGVISNIPGYSYPPALLGDFIALCDDEETYVRYTGILCLSEVVQSLPYSEFTVISVAKLASVSGDLSGSDSNTALDELGACIVHFASMLDIHQYTTTYIELLRRQTPENVDQDSYYEHLSCMAVHIANHPNPAIAQLFNPIVSVITSALSNGVIGDDFKQRIVMTGQKSPSRALHEIIQRVRTAYPAIGQCE